MAVRSWRKLCCQRKFSFVNGGIHMYKCMDPEETAWLDEGRCFLQPCDTKWFLSFSGEGSGLMQMSG